MARIKGLLWWAYLDDAEKIHIKRYVTDRVIENYERMPFVKGIFPPFEAYDLKDAQKKILQFLSQDYNNFIAGKK